MGLQNNRRSIQIKILQHLGSFASINTLYQSQLQASLRKIMDSCLFAFYRGYAMTIIFIVSQIFRFIKDKALEDFIFSNTDLEQVDLITTSILSPQLRHLMATCSIQQYNKVEEKMGCSDSQASSTPPNNITNPNEQEALKGKAIHFAPDVEDDSLPQNRLNKSKKYKSKSKNKFKHQQGEAADTTKETKEQKQNIVKVKKARNLRHHPEHDKFIQNILQKSRAKITVEFPQIPKNQNGFVKPVVEYSGAGKGQILPNESKMKEKSKWDIHIFEEQGGREQQLEFNHSYVSINENVKSPYRQKEIEKRLNAIRNGRFEQSQSGQLARHRRPLFQELECSYIQ